MIELTVLNVVHIVALCMMLFFWGVSVERNEETQELAKKIWQFCLVIVWLCILIQ